MEYLKRFFKSKQFTVCIVCSLLLGATVGIVAGGNVLKSISENDGEKASKNAASLESGEKNSKGTEKVEIKTFFTLCGHDVVRTEEMDITKGVECQTRYGNLFFNNKSAMLCRTVEGFCPKHYVVRIKDERFVVYKRNADTFKDEYIMDITKAVGGVEAEIEAELEKGIPFLSLEEIDQYFENINS